MKVLLVDDEEELVVTLAERLSLRDIEADWALCGEDALRLAAERPYDLAVLDMKMPKMNGLQLKAELQKLSPAMRFIFLTGHGSEEDFEAGASEAGADNYLIKPVNIQELVAKIHAAFDAGEE
ncbi:response regulator receiver protein [Desulfobulbus propionicus DSM 2032]|jgi:DNA-binding response OmpR family regulator|uniref:Response regulator receiver protein n=1 Tax=Desulfobulbus propionicus (strain ATCC 33891 / DSM 2032 / VKM B-1956 / 1pr3) TaxID=577650 RepID=A0A7U3YPF1_DESPD|nr:response regulator [Desulfobulbus propionicus]ADW18983.1 response regulator receiver protein [Desulfobulbus propionicus DSM 2032]